MPPAGVAGIAAASALMVNDTHCAPESIFDKYFTKTGTDPKKPYIDLSLIHI